ncbi:MAG TPA: TetR/AcrR family transcriptional regulator [Solirubrobacteraceae bacterium]|jgi:AcrR family transcriptional regulator|nr:TetR/AcrR family transcriptional regulator [Solirubrobacteraceae bacterium]
MSSRERPSLRDEQKALTRQRLIEAADAVFATQGFCGASVEEIARRAGATTGALYSNFSGKEDLFLELFEDRTTAHMQEYCEIFYQGETPEEQARAGADRWMRILRERPDYFPLLIEFWTYALREPEARRRFADRFAAFRAAIAQQVSDGAAQRGIPMTDEMAQRLGLVINALGNGIALEKLVDPEGVPDELFGDVLVLISTALEALAQNQPG